MVKVPKRKSKRQTLHHKYKVEKKIREHRRKQRREAKKNPGGKKLKKDPGIPNLYPLKDEMLAKMEKQKEKLEAEKARQKERRKEQVAEKRGLAAMVAANAQREKDFEQQQAEREQQAAGRANQAALYALKDGSKKAYYREFKKILDVADVILEVLDARDPLGCRCTAIEERILQSDPHKKVILVLNKIDLVPKENVEQWLKYLRNYFPTVAFKCTTQHQRHNLAARSHRGAAARAATSAPSSEGSECLGADTLIQLLKNYCRNKNIKTAVSVGIIGFPNVGKSSLINSLKRAKAVGVGATAGFTKTVQEVELDRHIKLLDCPGIVWGTAQSDNDIVLRNCVKVERIVDATEPVEAIIKRCRPEQLLQLYEIPAFSDVTGFLIGVANKRGKLGKGGKADLQAAARSVLLDWNTGRIRFYTSPPDSGVHVAAAVVPSYAAEFDFESVINTIEQPQVLGALPSRRGADATTELVMAPGSAAVAHLDAMDADDVDASDALDPASDDDEGEEEGSESSDGSGSGSDMDDDAAYAASMADVAPPPLAAAAAPPAVPATQRKAQATSTVGAQKAKMADASDVLNPQTNRGLKKLQKKLKKSKQKTSSSSDAYDFATDFLDDNGSDDGMEDDS